MSIVAMPTPPEAPSTSTVSPSLSLPTSTIPCQLAVHKQVQELGLQDKYTANEDAFSLRVARMAALAFLPQEDVPVAWDNLKLTFTDED